MNKLLYFILCGLSICINTTAQQIIPLPQKITFAKDFFNLNKSTVIYAPAEFRNEAVLLQQQLESATGNLLMISEKVPTKNAIILVKQNLVTGEESYHLNIDNKNITISAADAGGAFYGCISLIQLLPIPDAIVKAKAIPLDIPSVSITDFPRFKWRGLMLDVSRTFMKPEYIKKTIERMSFYKLNVLQLHLTDDQGWRLPIKNNPLLIKKGSTFDSSFNEPKEFQGHYTMNDIKDIISYAASRHVEIVPEIESPGHSHAALFAYPELSCTGKISPIFPYFAGPDIDKDVFCVSNPGSLNFFQSVISETATIFPSKYLHLGGDEVPRDNWENCPKCQALVKSKKLENTGALQGYFMEQLRDYTVKKGKRVIAWNEILDDNKALPKDWIIMSWTSILPGIKAAEQGYDVVLTPNSHLYFDYTYEKTNTKKVFEFDPLAGNKSDTVRNHILGIQACFWSHIDRTESKTDWQLFPRLLGLAERGWSSAENKDYENFRLRKLYHRPWLNFMKVKYYIWDFK